MKFIHKEGHITVSITNIGMVRGYFMLDVISVFFLVQRKCEANVCKIAYNDTSLAGQN